MAGNLVITGLSKLAEGTWGEPIPFGADATNVYLTSALTIAGSTCHTVQEALTAIQNGFNRGNASAPYILSPYSAVVGGTLVYGSMANRGVLNWTPTNGTTQSVASGYYSGGTLDSRTAYNNGYKAGTNYGRSYRINSQNKSMWYNIRTDPVEGYPSNAYRLITSGSAFNGYINKTSGFNGTWALGPTGAFSMNSYWQWSADETPKHKNDYIIFNVLVQNYTNYFVIMKQSRYDDGSADAGNKSMFPDNGIVMECYGDNVEVGRFGNQGGYKQLPFDNDTTAKHVATHEFWVKAGDIGERTLHLKFWGCRYDASYVIIGIK